MNLKLLFPALIPSWRFFDEIAPSPRIEFALLQTSEDKSEQWQEFRPRPASLSPAEILRRLFYNPRGNENLFLVSCAERLMQNPTDHSVQEISKRIAREISAPYFQFRLVFVEREGQALEKHITYLSPVFPGTAS